MNSEWHDLELTAFWPVGVDDPTSHLPSLHGHFALPQLYGATIYLFCLSRAASGPVLALQHPTYRPSGPNRLHSKTGRLGRRVHSRTSRLAARRSSLQASSQGSANTGITTSPATTSSRRQGRSLAPACLEVVDLTDDGDKESSDEVGDLPWPNQNWLH